MTVTSHPALEALDEARRVTLSLVLPLEDRDLERVYSPLMSPLAWDLAHIASYEDLWLAHRHADAPLLRPDLAELYDAFETPRAKRGEIDMLPAADAFEYLRAVRDRVTRIVADHGTGDGTLFEMVAGHEHQHCETMLQTLMLARLPGYRPAGATRAASARGPGEASSHTGDVGFVEVPAGPFELGARAGRFAYDNERPWRTVDVPAFRIARTPVTNASWLTFTEGGGYERREWWSDEGWAWKEQYDITRPAHWTADGREWRLGGFAPLAPDRPVVHVSWFEADAFARAHGARLPTEIEWEKAATWDRETEATRNFPWGQGTPDAQRANLIESGEWGPASVEARPDGRAPCGALATIGDVWEWTSSEFTGYPGFAPHPYREYSEVFFDRGYRVLRGGSWATSERVATPTFRNWDLPQRRQIFAGLRLAGDS
jgi:iron(II)-dependent oxidoreductase